MLSLQEVADIYGYEDEMDMLEDCVTDSLVPCCCRNDNCEYTTELEPDCTNGWCEECREGSLVSVLIMAGIM